MNYGINNQREGNYIEEWFIHEDIMQMSVNVNKKKERSYNCVLVVTKSHKQGALNNTKVFSHSSGVWKFKSQVLSGLVFTETSLHGL